MTLDFIRLPAGRAPGVHGAPMPKEFIPGLVSVVLPTYNRASFLLESLNSVWDQTYRPVELLVVDDGSSDNTPEVVQQTVDSWPYDPAFRAIYLQQPNSGASAARNQGLLHSHGEFIQYLDSDDVLVRHKLSTHVHVLHADEALDIVWSEWLVVSSAKLQEQLEAANHLGNIAPATTVWQATAKAIPGEPWPTLTRRRFVSGYPLWNERASRWDDLEYALRIMAANPRCVFAPGVACIQRHHEQGRRQDLDFNPVGIEKGLVATREASAARDCTAASRPEIDQLLADMYWNLFLESLHHGSIIQASESISGACRYGRQPPFRIKVTFLKKFLLLAGASATRALLEKRYLRLKFHDI